MLEAKSVMGIFQYRTRRSLPNNMRTSEDWCHLIEKSCQGSLTVVQLQCCVSK